MTTQLYREKFLDNYFHDQDYKNRIDAYLKYFNKDVEKHVKPALMDNLYIPKGALQVKPNCIDTVEVKRSRKQQAVLFRGATVNMCHYDDNIDKKTAISLPIVTYKTKSGQYYDFIVDQHLIMQNGIDYILPQGIIALSSMPLNS